jgi:glycosyltransferase involved in cell wall biosynthesis
MKKTIVISAINFFEGGPLSILRDCVSYLEDNLADRYNIIVFVHKTTFFRPSKINFVELPKSRKSYINRLYYEYIWFYFQSIKIRPYLWLSLHDMTPNVKAEIRAVYCHNPSPFYKISLREFILEPSFGVFNMFYKYLYRINLNKNKCIIVQQNWLRDIFRLNLKSKPQIIVAPPKVKVDFESDILVENSISKPFFFYPSLSRVFKNFECVCDAAKILSKKDLDFEVLLTICGNENKYAIEIYNKYKSIKQIKFGGILKREQVFQKFQLCSALVFPSKLETWGLPITEAKLFMKPILVSNSSYAFETVGDYDKVAFFNPDDPIQLATLMEQIINKTIQFDGNKLQKIDNPLASNWDDVFSILLNE